MLTVLTVLSTNRLLNLFSKLLQEPELLGEEWLTPSSVTWKQKAVICNEQVKSPTL
jgi:hypothetical protein